jgi:C1A family cysteine protease
MTRKGLLVRLFLGLSMLALFMMAGGVVGAASDAQVQWQAEINLSFTAAQMSQPDWQANANALQSALNARVAARGASMQVTRQMRSDVGLDVAIDVKGKGNLQQYKQVIFDDIEPLGGFLGGPVSLALTGEVEPGETVPIVLESNPATGFLWDVGQIDKQKLRRTGGVELISKAMLLGAPMKQTVRVTGVGKGVTTLVLLYRRSWQKDEEPTRKISIQVAHLSMLSDLSNPAPLQGVPAATGHNPEVTQTLHQAPTLPGSYDWRLLGKVPPIRDQKTCGSCWAFGTVGAFESALLIKGGVLPNLSEQYLVSCNTDGWGCNGGWFAHDYHWLKPGKTGNQPGAVQETAFPYVANDKTPCYGPYAHPYQLSGWSYIGDSWSVPPAAAIKDAIYNYGPVAAAVCVGMGFDLYTGGVFNTNEAGACGSAKVNHAVVLVGWDDTDNTWILRNSWGTGWGEGGYMHIDRGVSNIGFAANYVDYTAPTTATVEDSGPSVQYNGWRGVGDAAANGGAYRVSNTTNDSATFKFTATSVKWITRRGPDQGKASVTIDGKIKGTFDLYNLSAQPNVQLIFSGLPSASHSIVVKVLGTKNSRSTNFNVAVDGFIVGNAVTQESSRTVQYGSWLGVANSNASGGSYRYSRTAGAMATFTFSGTSVTLITDKCSGCGRAEVYLDGVDQGMLDLYAPSTWQWKSTTTYGGLSAGTHTIRITVLGTKSPSSAGTKVTVDAFRYSW